jgi:outer membrane protein
LSLDLDDSFGLAAQLGADFDISDTMFMNFDVRWIDINTDAKLEGAALEEVEIDPLVYSLTVGWKF